MIAPSPLAGEGSSVVQWKRMGEGRFLAGALRAQPLTRSYSLTDPLALSRKGRGRINNRPARCDVQQHHAPPTLTINSPDGATVHASFWNSTVVVPCSCTSAGPAILVPAVSFSR